MASRRGSKSRSGCNHLGTHAIALGGLDHWVGDHLALRPARNLRGQLARKGDLLLDEQRGAAASEGRDPVVRLVCRGDDAHAFAVVAATGGLEHGHAAMSGKERLHVGVSA